MKIHDFFLLVILLIVFIPDQVTDVKADVTELAGNEGMVAVQILASDDSSEVKPEDAIVPEELCKCNGKGYTVAVDGNKIQCKCGPSCKCTSTGSALPTAAAVTKVYQMYWFTQDPNRCPPCKQFLLYSVPELIKLGWGMVDSEQSKIRKIDIAQHGDLYEKYCVNEKGEQLGTPSFIMLDDGKWVGSLSGYRTPKEITDFYYSKAPK